MRIGTQGPCCLLQWTCPVQTLPDARCRLNFKAHAFKAGCSPLHDQNRVTKYMGLALVTSHKQLHTSYEASCLRNELSQPRNSITLPSHLVLPHPANLMTWSGVIGLIWLCELLTPDRPCVPALCRCHYGRSCYDKRSSDTGSQGGCLRAHAETHFQPAQAQCTPLPGISEALPLDSIAFRMTCGVDWAH